MREHREIHGKLLRKRHIGAAHGLQPGDAAPVPRGAVAQARGKHRQGALADSESALLLGSSAKDLLHHDLDALVGWMLNES